MKEHRKQHIVPVRYLQRFAKKKQGKGYFVACRDVSCPRFFFRATSDVAYIEYFYSTKDETDLNWEDYYAKEIEPLYGDCLENLISNIYNTKNGECVLTAEDIFCLSKLIACQYTRMPNRVNKFTGEIIKAGNIFLPYFIDMIREQTTDEQLEEAKHLFGNWEYIKHYAIGELIKLQAKEIIEKLKNSYWEILFNNTSIPFFTSDDPIVIYNFDENVNILHHLNIMDENASVIYPISSTVLVQVVSPKSVDPKIHINNGLKFEIAEDEIMFLNNLQFYNCYKQIYFHPDYMENLK